MKGLPLMVGYTYCEEGLLDLALKEYSTSLSFKPDHVNAYVNRGLVLRDLGRLEEAVEEYQKAREAQLKPGHVDDAVEGFRKALKIRPDFALAYCGLGLASEARGQQKEAALNYRKAMAIDPGLTPAQKNLSRLLDKGH